MKETQAWGEYCKSLAPAIVETCAKTPVSAGVGALAVEAQRRAYRRHLAKCSRAETPDCVAVLGLRIGQSLADAVDRPCGNACGFELVQPFGSAGAVTPSYFSWMAGADRLSTSRQSPRTSRSRSDAAVTDCAPGDDAGKPVPDGAYRITVEAMTNAVRHAEARTCRVALTVITGLVGATLLVLLVPTSRELTRRVLLAGCLLLGYPVALGLVRAKTLAPLILIVILLPFWTSVLVRAYAWLVLLQRTGVTNQMLERLGLVFHGGHDAGHVGEVDAVVRVADSAERQALAVLGDPVAHRPLGEAAAALVHERYAQDVTLPALARETEAAE